MCVSVLLCGPIGSHGGSVGVQRLVVSPTDMRVTNEASTAFMPAGQRPSSSRIGPNSILKDSVRQRQA